MGLRSKVFTPFLPRTPAFFRKNPAFDTAFGGNYPVFFGRIRLETIYRK
jgi:hypothetical protein